MKFFLSQIEQLLNLMANGQVKRVLLYGPDKGYIDKVCSAIVKKLDLLPISMEYDTLKNRSLNILLNSKNFFAKKELIKIKSCPATIDIILKTALSEDFFHFIVFIADELSPSSTLRKFFEAEKFFASIGCYYDDKEKIKKIIIHKCTKANRILAPDVLLFLCSLLKGDHQFICNEIDKLIIFTSDKTQITLEDAKLVINTNFLASGDEMCIYFAKQDLENFLQEIISLQHQNINEVLIIRALIRFYLNLYIVLSKIKEGENIDSAIKSITPPIFYKYLNDFKKVANNLRLSDCVNVLETLQQSEIDFKIYPNSFNFFQQIYQRVYSISKEKILLPV